MCTADHKFIVKIIIIALLDHQHDGGPFDVILPIHVTQSNQNKLDTHTQNEHMTRLQNVDRQIPIRI